MFPVVQEMDSSKNEIFDMNDSISKELNELQEKLLKLNVQAQMLEVDIATLFTPNTILDIKRVDQKCQDGMKAQEELTNQTPEKTGFTNGFSDIDVEIQ